MMTAQPLGTIEISQIGLVVNDVEAIARAWADTLGLPVPPIEVTDPVDMAQTEYKGERTPARAKLAFFHFDNVQVELIEPVGEPSTWQDQLEEHGSSLHHIAFRIQGMQEKMAYLDGKGISLIQRGEYTGGRYAYLDAIKPLGLILELLEND
jgi:catechol 2,3-dioxygenase-like lactoylglutathione lyase family enzyme